MWTISVLKLGISFLWLMNVVLNSCTGDNKILYHGAAKETRGKAAKGRHIIMMINWSIFEHESNIWVNFIFMKLIELIWSSWLKRKRFVCWGRKWFQELNWCLILISHSSHKGKGQWMKMTRIYIYIYKSYVRLEQNLISTYVSLKFYVVNQSEIIISGVTFTPSMHD